jgi:hypothetical protein
VKKVSLPTVSLGLRQPKAEKKFTAYHSSCVAAPKTKIISQFMWEKVHCLLISLSLQAQGVKIILHFCEKSSICYLLYYSLSPKAEKISSKKQNT